MYRAVRGELAHAGNIQDRHTRPVLFVFESFAHKVLALYIGLIVNQQHIFISVQERIDQWPEKIPVSL